MELSFLEWAREVCDCNVMFLFATAYAPEKRSVYECTEELNAGYEF